MFYFVLEVIGVSILVSIFATWVRLIPRYPKKKYSLIQELIFSVFLTVLITLVWSLDIYPSWILLFAAILFILWLSVQITNNIFQRSGDSTSNPSKADAAKE